MLKLRWGKTAYHINFEISHKLYDKVYVLAGRGTLTYGSDRDLQTRQDPRNRSFGGRLNIGKRGFQSVRIKNRGSFDEGYNKGVF